MDSQAFKFTFFSNFFEPKSEDQIEIEQKKPIYTNKITEKRKALGQILNSNLIPKKFRPVTERNYRISPMRNEKLNITKKVNSDIQPIRCRSYLQNRNSLENLDIFSSNHLPKVNNSIKLLPVIHHYKKTAKYPESILNTIKFSRKTNN